jgi:hypothetical protein
MKVIILKQELKYDYTMHRLFNVGPIGNLWEHN